MTKMKFIIALIAISLTTNAMAQQASYSDMSDKYTKAVEFYGAKDYVQAAPLFEQIIGIGIELGEEEDEMVAFAKQASGDAYRRAGVALAGEKKYDQALELLTKGKVVATKYKQASTANSIGRVESQIYNVLAAEAFNSKDYATAAGIYKKGFDANSTDTEMGLNLAMSYLEMTPQDTTGYAVYKSIIALGDVHSKYTDDAAKAKDRYVYYKLLSAGSQAGAKNYAGVIATIEEALEVNPASAQAYTLMMQAATNAKNFRKVTEVGEKAAAAQTDGGMKSDVYFMMGAAYENLGNNPKAVESYGRVTSGKNVATAKAQIASLK